MSRLCRSTLALTLILALNLTWSSDAAGQSAATQRAGSRTYSAATRQRAASRPAPTASQPALPNRLAMPPRSRARRRSPSTPIPKPSSRSSSARTGFGRPPTRRTRCRWATATSARRSSSADQVEFAQIHVACDNEYELFVNGQPAGKGSDWRKMDVHDVAKLMRPGINVVAIKATNVDAGPAGLVARVLIKRSGGTLREFFDRSVLAHERQRVPELESAGISRRGMARGQGLWAARRRVALG